MKPKEVYDEIKRFTYNNNQRLDSIRCDDSNETSLEYSKRLDKLNLIIITLDIANYKAFISNLLSEIQKIAQLIGNNCSNTFDYLMYFKDEADENAYLYKKGYHDPWLYSQLSSSSHRYTFNLGKFRNMGFYIGHMLAWYKVYDPKNVKLRFKNSIGNKILHLKKGVTNEDINI